MPWCLLTRAYIVLSLLVRQIRKNNCQHHHRQHHCLPSYHHSYLIPFFTHLAIIVSIVKSTGIIWGVLSYMHIIRLLDGWNEMKRQTLLMITIIIILTRSYAALWAADLDWIVGPGYSLGRHTQGNQKRHWRTRGHNWPLRGAGQE